MYSKIAAHHFYVPVLSYLLQHIFQIKIATVKNNPVENNIKINKTNGLKLLLNKLSNGK